MRTVGWVSRVEREKGETYVIDSVEYEDDSEDSEACLVAYTWQKGILLQDVEHIDSGHYAFIPIALLSKIAEIQDVLPREIEREIESRREETNLHVNLI